MLPSLRSLFRAVTGVAIGLLLGGCSVFGIRSGYEEAAHTVLLVDGDFEIRQYDDALIARTVTTGSYSKAGNAAFRRLGGYIFGDNVTQDSVAMTTPVFQQQVDASEGESESIAMTTPVYQEQVGDEWVQTFVLPSEYTLETLPVPTDPNVEITTLPGAKVAVIRYSGFINPEAIEEKGALLREWMESQGLVAKSAARSAAYDPPWTLQFLRRNEVQIEID